MSDAGGGGGGCRCEAIRIKVSGEPSEGVIYCHCRDCRRSSGAPVSLFAGYRTEQVEIKRGTPKVYESSSGVSRSFCGDCGTPISYEDERLPGEIYLPIGVFDDARSLSSPRHTTGILRGSGGSTFGTDCRGTRRAVSPGNRCGLREERPSGTCGYVQ